MYPQILAFADLNGDNIPDILIPNYVTKYLYALAGEGGGMFASPRAVFTGSSSLYLTYALATPFKEGALPQVFLNANYEPSGTYLYYLGNVSK